jgi:uncharacterized protein (TIGR00369 family)
MTAPLTLQQLRELSARMPFNRSIGLRIAKTHKDGVTIEVPLREDLLNLVGMLHGGVSATIADAAVGIAILRHFGGKRQATTLELKINYFRPVADGKVVARSRLLRVGNQVVVGSVELRDGHGKATGTALVTYMLLDKMG